MWGKDGDSDNDNDGDNDDIHWPTQTISQFLPHWKSSRLYREKQKTNYVEDNNIGEKYFDLVTDFVFDVVFCRRNDFSHFIE